jgi:hypothetical protein
MDADLLLWTVALNASTLPIGTVPVSFGGMLCLRQTVTLTAPLRMSPCLRMGSTLTTCRPCTMRSDSAAWVATVYLPEDGCRVTVCGFCEMQIGGEVTMTV